MAGALSLLSRLVLTTVVLAVAMLSHSSGSHALYEARAVGVVSPPPFQDIKDVLLSIVNVVVHLAVLVGSLMPALVHAFFAVLPLLSYAASLYLGFRLALLVVSGVFVAVRGVFVVVSGGCRAAWGQCASECPEGSSSGHSTRSIRPTPHAAATADCECYTFDGCYCLACLDATLASLAMLLRNIDAEALRNESTAAAKAAARELALHSTVVVAPVAAASITLSESVPLPEDVLTDDTDLLFLAASIALPEDATTDDTDLLLLAASIALPEDIPSVQATRESEPVLSDKLESRASREAKKITRLMKQYQIDHLETPAVRFEFFNSAKHRYSLLFKSRGARSRAESKLAATAPLAVPMTATAATASITLSENDTADEIQTAETDLLPLAKSIAPTEDIPSVVLILPSDAILTDDKPNAAVPDTTAILVSPPVVHDHLTFTAESPATSTDLAPAPQDAAVSAAQDPITHSQSVVERVKSAEKAVVARAREFGERTGDQLAITQIIAYSPTRLEFDVQWLVKIGTSDRNQVHVSFFEPSVAKRLIRQAVKTEMSDETLESIVKTPYDPTVKKNIRRGGKNKKR